MASIYERATLTIYASHAPNSSVGCFVPRNSLLSRPYVLENLSPKDKPLSANCWAPFFAAPAVWFGHPMDQQPLTLDKRA